MADFLKPFIFLLGEIIVKTFMAPPKPILIETPLLQNYRCLLSSSGRWSRRCRLSKIYVLGSCQKGCWMIQAWGKWPESHAYCFILVCTCLALPEIAKKKKGARGYLYFFFWFPQNNSTVPRKGRLSFQDIGAPISRRGYRCEFSKVPKWEPPIFAFLNILREEVVLVPPLSSVAVKENTAQGRGSNPNRR